MGKPSVGVTGLTAKGRGHHLLTWSISHQGVDIILDISKLHVLYINYNVDKTLKPLMLLPENGEFLS